MKRARSTEEQIIAVLREQEAGAKTADFRCRDSASEATNYKWKGRCVSLEVSEAKRCGRLRTENATLQRPLADAMLEMPV
ncbi:MAG: hypothetical protein CNE89_12400 [Sphingomonadaceae bacterium MED-G03]|jgi:putative transposase|nr:MAG: hypothetical protein CNE89_12400 [Sphingomonadaceae bacterium MED-G03]